MDLGELLGQSGQELFSTWQQLASSIEGLPDHQDVETAEPDAEPEEDRADHDAAGADCRAAAAKNNFETWLEAIGHTRTPEFISLFKEPNWKTFQRLVRTWPAELGPIVLHYLHRSPPIHIGMVTEPEEKKAYLYFARADWSLGSRITADLLGYSLLHQLARSARILGAARHFIAGDVVLEVTWCTHKYRMGQDALEQQEAKGSGRRTHFYLVASRPSSQGQEPDHEPPTRRSAVTLAHVYHTTMWFAGTYPKDGGPCLSTRLLLTWGDFVPRDMFDLAEDVWQDLPDRVSP